MENTFLFDIVQRQRHSGVTLTKDVPINVTADEQNEYDKNAHKVWAFLEERWEHIGYVDRANAAFLAKFEIKLHTARVVGPRVASVVVRIEA